MTFLSRLRALWLSRLFNKKMAASELTSETISQKIQTEKIEFLLDACNSSSQHARNFYITFLLVSTYIAIIIWSTTDVMLLKETPIKLPLLDVELPITAFYTFAPYLYLLLHFNLLLQLCLLSNKLHRFNDALFTFKDLEDSKIYRIGLFPFAFSHTLSGRQHSWFLRSLLTTMVWITIIWLPLSLLIGLQLGFLAYHSDPVLYWQRWAIAIDLFILTIFWPIIRAPNGNGFTWIKQATGLSLFLPWMRRQFSLKFTVRQSIAPEVPIQSNNAKPSGWPMFEGVLSLITLVATITFSWWVAVLPDSDNEKQATEWVPNTWLTEDPFQTGRDPYFWLTEYLFDQTYFIDDSGNIQTRNSIFNRNLRIREKLLIANELQPEDQAFLVDSIRLREKIRRANEPSEELLGLAFTNDIYVQDVLKKTVGLTLRGRDFRYADFSGSLMPKVDFREIDGNSTNLKNAKLVESLLIGARMTGVELQNANLGNARLQGVNLGKAKLHGVILEGADLQDTDFGAADLQSGNLMHADLQGANLRGTNLQDATLMRADLQGATLQGANLQGANLMGARLQGADLRIADLQGVTWRGADLQGVDLMDSDLQGVNLEKTTLQGANLKGVDLRGATFGGADLQGANLENANLQGAVLENAKLQGTNLRHANLQGADLRYANLKFSNTSQTKFGKMSEQELKVLLARVTINIKNPEQLEEIKERLSHATTREIPTRLAEMLGRKIWILDELSYPNSTVGYFIGLSCENPWIASGIISYRAMPLLLKPSFAQCLLSLKDKKNQFGRLVCPAMSEINENTTKQLEYAEGKKYYDYVIPATFECKTRYSDKPQQINH